MIASRTLPYDRALRGSFLAIPVEIPRSHRRVERSGLDCGPETIARIGAINRLEEAQPEQQIQPLRDPI